MHIMDIVKEEPDSDSDCHQMSSLTTSYFDGVKEEQPPLAETASDAKDESWNMEEFLQVEVTTEEPEEHHKSLGGT
ncbi:uncharacterized protein LOC110838940 isoform X3 [Zootermopsis nevadensis]|uniref:uncharacterized protein LOC110838940 isoform X3 n=1 Tax=Zootermopsis nevadensis TaxID=136037 RepID=UPI000B8E5B73|nr:uncharacterized protein LOC110838940 isoform X3 [Zootermopsis nevadensis]